MIRNMLFLLPLVATACAPVPMTPERAARQCRAEASQADGISGSVGAGVSNRGSFGTGSITVTNRVFNPQTEGEFVADCIARRMEGRPEPTTFGVSIGGRT